MAEVSNNNNNKKYNNRNNWYKSSKKPGLEIGLRGFLATCNYREKDCVRECYNILNHYANELYGPMTNGTEKEKKIDEDEKLDEEVDISDDVQKEIDAAKAAAKPGNGSRFNSIDTGTKNCVFIKTSLPNPVELGTKIVKDIAETKIQKSRYLLRLTPIEVICQATLEEITKAAGALFDKYFLKEGKTFAIVLNRRFNNDIKRDGIIKILADLVFDKNVKNKVDLKNAELAVIVEIIKKKCCMSVVEGYFKYKKYNLIELASGKTNEKTEENPLKAQEDLKAQEEEKTMNVQEEESVQTQEEAIKTLGEAVKTQEEAVRAQEEAVKAQEEAVKAQEEAVKAQEEKFDDAKRPAEKEDPNTDGPSEKKFKPDSEKEQSETEEESKQTATASN